ncbi:MAG: T9SS type A sorting domain-containing protein [Cryomorphaceae bacterium]|nr:T9SS type A sorting domain-containing protein [Cryomorphaceae bacterium]
MRKLIRIFAGVLAFGAFTVNAQSTIHCWDFNSGSTSTAGGKWASPIPTGARVTGNGTITHNFTDIEDFAGSTLNACVGSPSGASFVPRGGSNTENNGSHMTMEFSTAGENDILLTFANRRTGTGFDTIVVSYSTNGGTTFTAIANVFPSSSSFNIDTVDFSAIAAVNNNANFQIRFEFFGATSASGNARIDNLKLQSLSGPPPPPPVVPLYSIADISSTNADGVVDSNNVNCAIEGVVSGGNLINNGAQFWFIDSTNSAGLQVRQPGFTLYTPTEGDVLRIYGTVNQFRGLVQFTIDSLTVLGTGFTLPAPAVVTSLGEATKGRLVRLNGLSLVSPSQWSAAGTGFNVDMTDGSTTFLGRITSFTTLFNDPAPTGQFDLIGHGGQFASSTTAPFNDGYQILPRYSEDLIIDTTVTPTPVVINRYRISDITTVDADGVVDSLGVMCSIVGVVSGGNLLSNGAQFWFIDSTNSAGLLVRQPGFTQYTPTEGDVLEIYGNVSQFRGLIQFSIDSMDILGNNFTLPQPAVVTTLDEATEGRLITIENLTLVDPTQWVAGGTGFNVDATNGADTFLIRVVEPTTLFNEPTPTTTFHIIGHGSQFNPTTTAPLLSGYQLQPRYKEDLITNISVNVATMNEVKVYPNPASQFVRIELTNDAAANVVLYNTAGQLMLSGEIKNGNTTINTENLTNGLYIARIVQDGNASTVRILINR